MAEPDLVGEPLSRAPPRAGRRARDVRGGRPWTLSWPMTCCRSSEMPQRCTRWRAGLADARYMASVYPAPGAVRTPSCSMPTDVALTSALPRFCWPTSVNGAVASVHARRRPRGSFPREGAGACGASVGRITRRARPDRRATGRHRDGTEVSPGLRAALRCSVAPDSVAHGVRRPPGTGPPLRSGNRPADHLVPTAALTARRARPASSCSRRSSSRCSSPASAAPGLTGTVPRIVRCTAVS